MWRAQLSRKHNEAREEATLACTRVRLLCTRPAELTRRGDVRGGLWTSPVRGSYGVVVTIFRSFRNAFRPTRARAHPWARDLGGGTDLRHPNAIDTARSCQPGSISVCLHRFLSIRQRRLGKEKSGTSGVFQVGQF